MAEVDRRPGGVARLNTALRLLLLLDPADPRRRLEAALERVGAEEWDLARVRAWLRLPSGAPRRRGLAVRGRPRSGKSSLCAAIWRSTPVHACLSCHRGEARSLDPMAAVRTLAYQLAQAFLTFEQMLVEFLRSKAVGLGLHLSRLESIEGTMKGKDARCRCRMECLTTLT